MATRADLINQLAASMGAGELSPTKFVDKRYNSETGTLYCNGKITKSVADVALKHFQIMRNRCKASTLETRQMADIYECAIEAIKIMQDPDVKAFLDARDANKAAI